MTMLRYPHRSAMTTSGPAFLKKKQRAKSNQLDAHAAQATWTAHRRQRKYLRDAKENLAAKRQNNRLRLTLKNQRQQNRSSVLHAWKELPTVWNVRSPTSNRKRECDISVQTNWTLATTTANRRLPAVGLATLPMTPKVAIPATTSIAARRLATVDSMMVPVTDLARANRVAILTAEIEDQNVAVAVAVVLKEQALPSLVGQVELAMAFAVETITAISMRIAARTTIAALKMTSVAISIAAATLIAAVMKIAAVKPIAMKRETMQRETTHGGVVGTPAEMRAVELTVVAEIQDAHRVRIVISPVVRTAVVGVGPVEVAAAAEAAVAVAAIAGEAARDLSRAVELQVVTAVDVVAGIEACRAATADRFSHRSKSSKAPSKVCWNCITAAMDFCATRRRIMRPKIQIRLSPAPLLKSTSSARVCWSAVMWEMERGIKDLDYAKWN